MVTIEVYYQWNGSPASNCKVEAWGDTVGEGRTDNNGKINLDIKPGNGKVWVDGSLKYEGKVEGRVVVYI